MNNVIEYKVNKLRRLSLLRMVINGRIVPNNSERTGMSNHTLRFRVMKQEMLGAFGGKTKHPGILVWHRSDKIN